MKLLHLVLITSLILTLSGCVTGQKKSNLDLNDDEPSASMNNNYNQPNNDAMMNAHKMYSY